MVQRTKDLEAYQEAEEDPEAAKCIPMLKREDIRKEADKFYNEELDVDGSLSCITTFRPMESAIWI